MNRKAFTAIATIFALSPSLALASSVYHFSFDSSASPSTSYTGDGGAGGAVPPVTVDLEIEIDDVDREEVTEADVLRWRFSASDGTTTRTLDNTSSDLTPFTFSGTQIAGGLQIGTLGVRQSPNDGTQNATPLVSLNVSTTDDKGVTAPPSVNVEARTLDVTDEKGVVVTPGTAFMATSDFATAPLPDATFVPGAPTTRVFTVDLKDPSGDWALKGEITIDSPDDVVTTDEIVGYTLDYEALGVERRLSDYGDISEKFDQRFDESRDFPRVPTGDVDLTGSIVGDDLFLDDLLLDLSTDTAVNKTGSGRSFPEHYATKPAGTFEITRVDFVTSENPDKTGQGGGSTTILPVDPFYEVEINFPAADGTGGDQLVDKNAVEPLGVTAPLKTYRFEYASALDKTGTGTYQSFDDHGTPRDWQLTGSFSTRSFDGNITAAELESFWVTVSDGINEFRTDLGGQTFNDSLFEFDAFELGGSVFVHDISIDNTLFGKMNLSVSSKGNEWDFAGKTGSNIEGILDGGFASSFEITPTAENCVFGALDSGAPNLEVANTCLVGLLAQPVSSGFLPGGGGDGGGGATSVPLPATGWLLFGALAGFGVAARRRRSST